QIGFHTVSQWAGKGSTAGVKWRGKYWVRNVADDALVLKFFQEIGISTKTGRILLAPDLRHLTWVNGWGSDPALVASLDIKMTMWEKDAPNVVTGPVGTLPKQATPVDKHLTAARQPIEPPQAPWFGTGNGILGVLPASSVPAAPPHQPQPVVQ